MKKRLLVLLVVLLLSLSFLSAQQSLLSYSTNRIFSNKNDWVSFPSLYFNSLEYDVVFAQGDYGRIDMQGKNGGGILFGYHATTKYPFTVGASFKFDGEGTNVHSIFENYYSSLRSIIGFPEIWNSSYGLFFDFRGKDSDHDGKLDSAYYDISIPAFFQIDNYANYAELHLEIDTYSESKNDVLFFFYDRFSFDSLIPKGKYTTVWAASGNAPFNLEQMEVPSFGSYLDRFVSGQVGISNRVDFTDNNISLVIIPKVYTDWLLGGKNGSIWGMTVASDVGVQYLSSSSFLGFSFGITPRLAFYFNNINSSSADNNIPTFFLQTNILWSGNFDFSFHLPHGFELDVALTVDRKGIPARLSVQCTWSI